MIDPKTLRDAVSKASPAIDNTAPAVDSRPISISTGEPIDADADQEAETEKSDWPDLVPFERPETLPLPLHLFPAWHARFIEAAATETETAPDLAAMVLLAAVATAVMRKMKIEQRPGFLLVVNIWTLALLGSGGRKSRVFSLATAPLSAFQQRRAVELASRIAQDESFKRRLQHDLDDAEKKRGAKAIPVDQLGVLAAQLAAFKPTRAPRLFVDEGTPEALEELLIEQNGRIALLSDEAGPLEALSRYADAPNLSNILRSHDGGDLATQRMRRADGIGGARYQPQVLSTLGLSIQPESYFAIIQSHPAYTDKGFAARFLSVLVPDTLGKRKHNTPSMPDVVKDEYSRCLEELLWIHTPPGLVFPVIEVSEEAKNALLAFEQAHELLLDAGKGDLAALRSWGSKLTSNLCRIAALFHVSEHRANPTADVLSLETMNRAIGLAPYFIAHAKAIAFEVGADEATQLARRALVWIKTSHANMFTRRDLHRQIAPKKPAAALEGPLLLLTERGFIRQLNNGDRTGPGRPSERYEVNPLFFKVP